MRERAARIGAKLALMTSASGTEIKLVVPGDIIFPTSNPSQQKLFAKIRELFRSKSQNSNLD
jgi:hypothetical protein